MWQTGDLLTSGNRKGVGEDYLIGYKQGMMGTRKHGPKFNVDFCPLFLIFFYIPSPPTIGYTNLPRLVLSINAWENPNESATTMVSAHMELVNRLHK